MNNSIGTTIREHSSNFPHIEPSLIKILKERFWKEYPYVDQDVKSHDEILLTAGRMQVIKYLEDHLHLQQEQRNYN